MEVIFWAGAGLFWFAFYRGCRNLGLFDSVPRDPKARAANHAFSVLALLKEQIYCAQVLRWEGELVVFSKDGTTREFRTTDASLHFHNGVEEVQLVLGKGGHCRFHLENERLTVDIVVRDEGGIFHASSVSLPVQFSSLQVQPS